MSDKPSFLDYNAWSTRTWVTALVAGVVALILFLLFGAGFFVALVIGILVFLAVVWWLQRDAAHEIATKPLHAPTPPPSPPPSPMPAPAAPAATFAPAPAAPAEPATPVGETVVPAAPAPAATSRPAHLPAPRVGGPDDLKRIKGVGPKLEGVLNSLGYYHFDQIAAWTMTEIAWVDSNLEGFSGRASRDDWVGQAKVLAAGGETEFSQRVDKGEVYD